MTADAPTIFISYRRDDAAGYAGRLADTLRSLLAGAEILRDVDGMIDPGADFKQVLAQAVESADVVLAVIGSRWLGARDLDGRLRLEDSRDIVRLELIGALDRGIDVIPVLVESAEMPDAAALPEPLRALAGRNAVQISDASWATQCEQLAEAIVQRGDARASGASVNLPTPPTELLGRERDLDAISALLAEGARLVTLTGPGGIGKTRVALEAAEQIASTVDKLVFCDATTVDDPELLLSAVARAAGLDESVEGRLMEVVARSLGPVATLLVLDNFEHLLAAGPTLAELLRLAPGMSVIVTSRAALRISGEREHPIEPLGERDAARLFIERARAVRPDIALGGGEVNAVSEICARLDGLPLAIELAAARVRLLSPEEMLGLLSERLSLLTQGAHDLPERQQTVRATIDWSYRLLDEPDRALLARMSVFAGGATLPAVGAVCAPDDGELDVLARLESLAENSLIFAREDAAGAQRFRMLELIREFASELVSESDEAGELRRRHADQFAELADRHGPDLERADLVAALARFDADYSNIVAALEWARDSADAELEARILGWLGDYWYLRGQYAEAWPWFEHALGLEGASPLPRGRLLRGAASLRVRMGDVEGATPLYEEALELFEQLGDHHGQARALSGLEDCYARKGDFERAERSALQALAIVREIGDGPGLAFGAANAGYTAMQRGQLLRARELFDESASTAYELGHPEAIANVQQNRGLLALLEGDLAQATEFTLAGLEGSLQLGEHLGILCGLIAAAAILESRPKPADAVRLLALVDAELDARDYVLDPVESALRKRTLERISDQLPESEIEWELAQGRELELLDATRRTIAELR